MKVFHIFETGIQEDTRREYLNSKDFKEDLVSQNIQRGKLLAIIVISMEAIIALIDVISYYRKVDGTFLYTSYLRMYFVMIITNLLYLVIINYYKRKRFSLDKMHVINILFIIAVLIWGCIISLMDQKRYGQLTVFMVNMMICSIVYYLGAKEMCIPYLIAILFIGIALPFYQASKDTLIGHYVNLAIFVIISWVISRIIYRGYCDNYAANKLMIQSNLLLENEIRKNKTINMRLSIANAQLAELALMDDLTKLSNRRGFRAFVEKKIQGAQMISVIMIDVDYFKQYNDMYGHENGDKSLISIADLLRDSFLSDDHIAVRWGGDEFIYAAFNTSQEDIVTIANSIRLKILNLKIPNCSSTANQYFSISMGTCTAYITNAKDIDNIINIADKALYQSKQNGRNCVATCSADEVIRGDETGKLD